MESANYEEYNYVYKQGFIKKNRGTNGKEITKNNITQNLLDSSLHSFDPNKSSPPNDFFMKSYLRLKHY